MAQRRWGYNLKPEFTNSYEVGFSGKNQGFDYTATIFYNQVEDQIEQLQRAGQTGKYWTFENVSKAKTFGMESSLGYDFGEGTYLSMAWNELQTENKDTGKELEFNPERTFSIGVDTPIMSGWTMGALATYTGKQYYTKMTAQGKKDTTTKAYTLVDLTTSYKFSEKNYEVYGGVNNLFDEKVDDVIGSNVGTYVYMGMRATF